MSRPKIFAVVPGNGAEIEYRDDDGGMFTHPVICFYVYESGRTVPMDVTERGALQDARRFSNFVRVL